MDFWVMFGIGLVAILGLVVVLIVLRNKRADDD